MSPGAPLIVSRMQKTIEELLAEPPDDARLRESSVFREAVAGPVRPVLFGAGMLGRKVAGALRRAGVEPLAFADNNAGLQGGRVEGVPVFAPAEAAVRWGGEALFVVTIWRATGDDGMAARVAWLRSLGCRRVSTFLTLGWFYDGVLPHFGADRPSRMLEHAAELRQAGTLWQDEQSRETYRRQLAWRLQADFDGVGLPVPDQYFPKDLFGPRADEVFVDGGAFDGDTLRRLPWSCRRIWAIEPDPGTVEKLRQMAGPEVVVCETALGRAAGRVRFNAAGSIGSARSDVGTVDVKVSALDDLLAGEDPTLVKLDIEGDELAALQGGRRTLERAQPIVAVCVYHRPQDLWEIPLYLHTVLPAHRLFLRIHEHDGFELVAYAVPPDRCLPEPPAA